MDILCPLPKTPNRNTFVVIMAIRYFGDHTSSVNLEIELDENCDHLLAQMGRTFWDTRLLINRQ